MSDLIFEIGTEELPAGFLIPASEQLESLFKQKSRTLNLTYGSIRKFCTPRRLALIVENLADRQEDVQEKLLGPSKKAAYDEQGNPSKAAEGFARSKGASVEDLVLVDTPKGQYLQLVRKIKGRETTELLPELLGQIILELSFPKAMKWGANRHTFARPIQWLLALFGEESIVFEHEGITAGAHTRGHRFMSPDLNVIKNASSYEETLESLYVIADPEKRKRMVLREVEQAVNQTKFSTPARVAVDQGLLDTVTNLVEYPFGICGQYDQKFLQVPEEVLITSMREHQKYFPVRGNDDSLLPGFVAVNNTKVLDPDVTREGHERVLRARLEDAYFFFESDKKNSLESRIDRLSGIIFQAKLGSMAEKKERIVKLSRLLAEILEPDTVDEACRAAQLCKADLTSDMVGEFPSLQGVMGAAYALNDGEQQAVAEGIKEHYMPLRSGAEIPSTSAGTIVGLADRIDTIAGCFGIGQIPTGTADPFGLRRLSLAVLHIIEGRGYTLSLPEVFRKALALYGDRVNGGGETVDAIIQFIKGRFVNDCLGRGIDPRAVDAVTSVAFTDALDCLKRIAAFSEIRQEESFDVLAGSFKRVRNIIKDNEDITVAEALFKEEAERQLYKIYRDLDGEAGTRLAGSDYLGFLKSMLKLKEPVDRFFDDVMVMVDDDSLRNNRLNLLTAVNCLILRVGDISRMHGG